MSGPRPVRLVVLVVVLAFVAVLVGVRALVRAAPTAPSLAPGALVLDGAPLAAPDPEEVAALRVACRRGSSTFAETVARVRAEHVAGSVVDSPTVLACPAGLDGLEVRLVGEVVGDVLPREGGAWLTINDDAHAREVGPLVGHGTRRGTNRGLAVWAPDGTHERLGAPGRAGRRGDLVVVVGTVRRADPDDGGGLTVRASAIEVLVTGARASAPLHRTQAVAAVVALTGVAIAGGLRLRGARRTIPRPGAGRLRIGRPGAGRLRRARPGNVRLSAGRPAPPPGTTGTAPRSGS